jgi:hypothetical protein
MVDFGGKLVFYMLSRSASPNPRITCQLLYWTAPCDLVTSIPPLLLLVPAIANQLTFHAIN